MSFTYIKLKGGKQCPVYQTKNIYSYLSVSCKWCGKVIKEGKAVFEADGPGRNPCCSLAHARAYMNAQI